MKNGISENFWKDQAIKDVERLNVTTYYGAENREIFEVRTPGCDCCSQVIEVNAETFAKAISARLTAIFRETKRLERLSFLVAEFGDELPKMVSSAKEKLSAGQSLENDEITLIFLFVGEVDAQKAVAQSKQVDFQGKIEQQLVINYFNKV